MKTWTKRFCFGILAASLAVWLSGCLSASYFFMVRYEPAKDEFAFMNVYQGIGAATPGDSQYLYQLWLNRDHVIRVPNIDIFAKPAFLRLSPTRYADINLGEAPQKLEPTDSVIPLDKIRVMPGCFFLRGPDTLCYYDQVVIPGTVVDQALSLFAKNPGWTTLADTEIKRRQDGGRRTPWKQFHDAAMKELSAALKPPLPPETAPATAPATQPEEEGPPNLVQILDDESLQLLRSGPTNGGIKFTREKQLFRFVIPLSTADARQIDQLWRTIVQTIDTAAAKPAADAKLPADIVSKFLPAFALTAQPRALELKIDLAIILKHLPLLADMTKPLGEPAPQELTKMRDAIAALKAHGVAIDAKITVEQLAKDFVADSLKSYPSDHPTEPGAGLVQEKAAPEPKK